MHHSFRLFWSLLLWILLAPVTRAQQPISILDIADTPSKWRFNNGAEFPGATGSLGPDAATPYEGHPSLKLAADFTKGGNYVDMGRKLDGLDIRSLSLRLKLPGRDFFTLRINDATNQTHQIRIKMSKSNDWQEVVLPLEKFFAERGKAGSVTTVANYESWGGAKDGNWHGPATGIYFILGKSEDLKTPTAWLGDILITPPTDSFTASFNDAGWQKSWKTQGAVALDTEAPFKGAGSLRITRTLDDVDKAAKVVGPGFSVAPGTWEIAVVTKAKLQSPDNSYRAIVELVALDAGGQELERITAADIFGEREWKAGSVKVVMPRAAVTAHLEARLDKTYGSFWMDEVSVRRIAPPPANATPITRLLFSTAQLGNLLLPADPREIKVEVLATRALTEKERALTWVLRDYWGAEHTAPAALQLSEGERKDRDFVHRATIDLSKVPLNVGRYYEVYAEAGGDEKTEPFRHNTSFAILPEAEAKKYPPQDIPFSSRNWDNRIGEYIRLSDRFGIRTVGLWGGWSGKAPYKPELPQIELIRELGLRWLSTTPCAAVEGNKKDYDETALRDGAKNFLAAYGKDKPFVINLGNEPHGTGDKVLRNVAAYKAVYQAMKEVDPSVLIVATSVEPNEEYFRAGYGQWCDAFDFHIYETAADVRRTMKEYRALMAKYHVEKPLWSTELGLNSQGMTRQRVASEVYQKTAAFFAEGGANMTWFTFLYPDRDGKSFGSSGDSHNIFDCRFNHYAPRLDAIAWFNCVNGMTVKKFAGEKTYPSGIQATLFRDKNGASLLFLWKDKGRADITLPLPSVKEVTAIRIDGRRSQLNAGGADLTLSVDTDPLVLLYHGGPATLPAGLEASAVKFDTLPASAKKGAPVSVRVSGAKVEIQAPPFWTPQPENGGTSFLPPAKTLARELELIAPLADGRGELYARVPLVD